VEVYQLAAKDQGLIGYAQYLDNYPNITSPTNAKQCGNAREYFGFDAHFLNDDQVCEDIYQLRFTDDFDFLNEFFNQGSSGNTNLCSGDASCLLQSPDLDFDSFVLKGKQWRSANFALAQIAQGLADAFDLAGNLDCPFSGPICVFIKSTAIFISFVLYVAFRLVSLDFVFVRRVEPRHNFF
jgi:hypothetical protein